jgi:hypothetical protein
MQFGAAEIVEGWICRHHVGGAPHYMDFICQRGVSHRQYMSSLLWLPALAMPMVNDGL